MNTTPARHLILGAGPAGLTAAETLRKLDPAAQIAIIGDEQEMPYSRMAIPYLLRGNIGEDGTHLRQKNYQDYFAKLNISCDNGRAVAVDKQNRRVEFADGKTRDYDKLLIATGSHPITPPIDGLDLPQVCNCWTLSDARKIMKAVKPNAPVVLIGAGFIGCIILEALVAAGAQLTVIEAGERMVPRMLDATCGALLQKWCEARGLRVITGAQVASIEKDATGVRVKIKDGEDLPAELVISATGVRANADFLKGCVDLKNDAVLVDEFMRTADENIFAAGDVACGKEFGGGYSVQAIQPVAVEHARVAANNMHKFKSVAHHGALPMNVLDTIGLVSVSYGQWQGKDGGERAELIDTENFRYINLCFADDRLIGANTLGMTQHIGVIRGLIQGRFKLGKWRQRLIKNPLQVMECYLAVTQG